MQLPNKKITNYVEQQSGNELLIYNLATSQAYYLNETAAQVFSACDGTTSFEALEKRSKLSNELINLTLHELNRQGLIESSKSWTFIGMNRREVIKRVGLGTMAALPVISSLVAPTAAQAASGVVGLGANCTNATCSSGLTCTTQFNATVCRASPGATCTFARPDLCTTGCCTASPNGPVCCQ